MKKNVILPLVLMLCTAVMPLFAQTETGNPRRAHKGWRLVWAEEFDSDQLDTTSWSRCKAGGADWMRHMSPLDSLCRVEDGTLRLYGIRTPEGLDDDRPCITGGVDSKGKRSLRGPARIDVRARFDCAQGFWPAIWLMPDSDIGWLQMIECLKGYWLEAGTIGLTAIFLPLLRTIKHKIPVIPLPFLYKGGLEYIRMFRLYGWIYPFLLLIGLIGVSHGNIRLVKVLLILWGIIQGAAFTNRPKRQELTYFLNLSTFQKYLILSNAWNVTVTSIPLIGIMLSFSCNWENILFAVCALTGSTLYLWNLGMAQYIFFSTITMTIYQLTILIPLFFYACLVPFLLIILMVINIVFYLFIKNDSKSIWN